MAMDNSLSSLINSTSSVGGIYSGIYSVFDEVDVGVKRREIGAQSLTSCEPSKPEPDVRLLLEEV